MSSKIKNFLSSLVEKKDDSTDIDRQLYNDIHNDLSIQQENITKEYQRDSFNTINNFKLFKNMVSLIDSLHMNKDYVSETTYNYKKSINNIYLEVEKNEKNIHSFVFKDEKDTPLFKVEFVSGDLSYLQYTIDNVVIKEEQATSLLNGVNAISIFQEIEKEGIQNVLNIQKEKSNGVVDRIMEYRNKNNIPFSNTNLSISKS